MIRELKTFMVVVQEGNFAAAGDKIGLTQAAVSAQMLRLEAELGFDLFDRSGRSARINLRGQQLLPQVDELLTLYRHLGDKAELPRPAARVTLGAIASIQRSLLPTALTRFHKQFPGCQTRIVPGLSLELVNLVDAGELDLAAVIRPPFALQTDLHWTTLRREPYRLIVPRQVTGDEAAQLLATHPFIRYDRTSFGGRQVDRYLRERSIDVQELCEVDELEAIVKLVANGLGVALVPQTQPTQRWPKTVRVVEMGAETFYREVGLVQRAGQANSELAGELGRLLVEAG
ncbi:MAG: LysR family transcriptional regulator [Pantoea sp.]|uniref:LysR family transcriptional regulator n=1 Tax=Pantoea sp. TaxID=69393 RepID=UPI0039E6B91D